MISGVVSYQRVSASSSAVRGENRRNRLRRRWHSQRERLIEIVLGPFVRDSAM